MKRLLKNIFLAHMIVLILFTGMPGVGVLAQEASTAATTQQEQPNKQSSASATPDQTNDTPASTSSELLPAPSSNPAPITRLPEEEEGMLSTKKASDLLSLDFDEPVLMSAVVKQPLRIRPLTKHDYDPTEPVTLFIDNAVKDEIQLTLFDTNDIEIETKITKTDTGDALQIYIEPPVDVKPGKYVAQAIDSDDQVAEVSFTWGVLSFNTDKTVYRGGEKVNMFMGVTDEQGNIDCDAKVTVTITDPEKKTTELSTEDDTVSVNAACNDHGPSQQADYETGFIPVVPGLYDLTMKAVTHQGTYTLNDQVSVQTEDVPYIIKRAMPTRIFPIDPFAVTLEITAKQDFTGTIRDIAPGDFVLTPSTSSATLEQITNRVSSASAQRRGFSGYPIGQLRIPFEGDHAMSLDFGGTIQDPILKNLYRNFGLLGHDGLDFAMPIGTPILSTDAGTVLWAGPGDYGETVIIEHAWGRSYYGHLSEINVTVGDFISKGAQIALSGNTGISTGPHLHFGIKPAVNDTHNGYFGKIDPLPYLTLSDNSQILSGKTSGDFQTVKIISWDVTLKKDETVTLVYTMKAPERHPAVHLIGPVQFVTKNEDGTQETIVQSDTKLWQVVADQAPVLGAQTSREQTKVSHFAMEPIDPALFTVPEGYPLRLASFGTDIKGTMSVTNVSKDQVVTKFTVKDETGTSHAANFTLQNAIEHETTKTNYTLHRKDIFPNVDMDYTTHDGYLQQVLTIKSDQARREFAFAMDLSSDMVLENLDSTGGHAVIKHKTTGEELMTLRYPQGIDERNQRIDYKYRIENDQLVLYPNRVWQYDQAVFPIKIYAPMNAVAWSEAEIRVGDSCEETTPCERDGDIAAIRQAGWHWSLNARKENVIVKIEKLSSEERFATEARTITTENTDDPKKPKEFKGKMKERVAAYEGLRRFGIDYTTLATPEQLTAIRNKKKQEYAPTLDARSKKNIIKKKSQVTASIISHEKKLAYNGTKEPNVFAKMARAIFKPASAATTQTATIGSAGGRDYTDPQAWETDNDNNLVAGDLIEKGVMYNDSVYTLAGTGYSISGATTDATRYMWLTVAESDRHNGVGGTTVSHSGVFIDGGASSTSAVTISNIGTVVEWLEITNISGTSGLSAIIVQNGASSVVVQYLLLHDLTDPTQDQAAVRTSSSSTDSFTIRNSIIYDYDRYAIRGNGAADTIDIENVTMWGDSTESDYGINDNASTINSENCISMNTATADFLYGTLGTNTYNLSEDATADDDGGTGHKISQTASIQFVSTTGGSENLHLVSTATAIDSGTSSVGLTDDIDAFNREGTFDIGADEFPNPPLIRVMRHGKYFNANGVRQPFTF